MGIAYIPEGGRVFPDLTVEDNLKLIASLCKNELNVRKRLDMIYSLFPVLRERPVSYTHLIVNNLVVRPLQKR